MAVLITVAMLAPTHSKPSTFSSTKTRELGQPSVIRLEESQCKAMGFNRRSAMKWERRLVQFPSAFLLIYNACVLVNVILVKLSWHTTGTGTHRPRALA